jgi:hypothetical protein
VECQLIGGSVAVIAFPYDIRMGFHGDYLLQWMGTVQSTGEGKVASLFLKLFRLEEPQLTQDNFQHSSHSTSTSSSIRAWEAYDRYKKGCSIIFHRKTPGTSYIFLQQVPTNDF